MEASEHDRLVRLEERLSALSALVATINPADHDRILVLEAELRGLNRLNDERGRLFIQRFEMEAKNLGDAVEALRTSYMTAHAALVARVDDIATQQAGLTGTSSGTLRIFLVAAVMISLIGLVVTLVHLISP